MENTTYATASQVFNKHVNNGDIVFYADVTPRTKENLSEPQLSGAKESYASLSIFQESKKASATFYLEPGDPAYLLDRVKINMTRDTSQQGAEEDVNPDCHNLTFKFGPFKGMTPAQVVAEKSREEINPVYQQLKQTSAQYKDNARLCQAIFDACNLKKDGKLVACKAPEIILEGIKTPDNKKVDANGNTKCRSLSIKYISGADKPYIIEISNFMAPPVEGAKVGAKFSKATDKVTYSIELTEREMHTLCTELVNAKMLYASATAKKRLDFADKHTWKPDSSKKSS